LTLNQYFPTLEALPLVFKIFREKNAVKALQRYAGLIRHEYGTPGVPEIIFHLLFPPLHRSGALLVSFDLSFDQL
jgi:hypothetical protein